MTLLEAVGWTLVHFLWQGAAVSLGAAVALRLLHRASSNARYAVAVAALCAMAVLPLATAWRLLRTPSPATSFGAAGSRFAGINVGATPPVSEPAAARLAESEVRSSRVHLDRASSTNHRSGAFPALTGRRLEAWLPAVVALWAAGVLLLSLRLIGGWVRTRRFRASGVAAVPEACRDAAARLAAHLGVRRPVQLLESRLLDVPVAIGWLKPVVLLPASALSGLTLDQLDAILAHELAHIRRHDYLVNLAQSVLETVLFYHPAVWWVSRQVRQEREHCCDDLAVAVCGDPHGYARALVDMERLRRQTPLYALGATGGSLVKRVRRLVAPDVTHADATSRWAASVIAVTTALTVGAAAGVPAGGGTTLQPQETATPVQPAASATPVVVQGADVNAPLTARWAWAEREARTRGYPRYWVGYTVPQPQALRLQVYSDRGTRVTSGDSTFSGTMSGMFDGFRFPGVAIGPLVGGGDVRTIKLLFAMSTPPPAGGTGLTRLHASSFALPVDLSSLPLVWLGPADSGQSLPLVERLFAAETERKLKVDLVNALGLHDDSAAVVPLLTRLLTTGDSVDVRREAAERLAWHPLPASLAALERAARQDQARDVRREAAETIGELDLPGATPALLAIIKTVDDPEVRRDAVEALGERPEPNVHELLAGIARSDRSTDVQREAVETLGELENGAGVQDLVEIARSHSSVDVRREAIESLGEAMPAADAVPFLTRVAREDAPVDVQREAVETLADIEDARVAPTLSELARTHPNPGVQRTAIECLAQVMTPAEVVPLLARLAREDAKADVQREAVESLGEIDDAQARSTLLELAKSHPNADVRRRAVESIGQAGPPEEAVKLLAGIAKADASVDVQREAAETIGEIESRASLPALVDLARTHPNVDVRREATEALSSVPVTPEVVAHLAQMAKEDRDTEVQREAIETLGELADGRGISEITSLALTHPQPDARREAIETLAEHAPAATAIDVLRRVVMNDRDEDVRGEAIEALTELPDGAGIQPLIDLARTHADERVRLDVIRRLVESEDPRARALVAKVLTRP